MLDILLFPTYVAIVIMLLCAWCQRDQDIPFGGLFVATIGITFWAGTFLAMLIYNVLKVLLCLM